METLTFDLFVGYLRNALHHLYDPDELRRSPLASFFGAAGFDAVTTLQRILTDAIEAMQPSPNDPPQSRGWRLYDALMYRYVQGFDRDVVAGQLGVSGRQLRREQRAALEILADRLWKQHGAGEMLTAAAQIAAANVESSPAAPAWLRDLPPERPAALQQVLGAILTLTRPLATQWNVRVIVPNAETLPDVSVPQVALRHALLGVLGVAIARAQDGEVRLDVALVSGGVEIALTASMTGRTPFSEREQASLDVARHLANVAGGVLTIVAEDASLVVRLILPTLEQIAVLVVDDNADTLQLFERYLAGTHYCMTGTREPRQTLRLVQELVAPIVVLDVMMPEIDGWEILAQLRGQPTTAGTTVIVCTVLPQEGLALALGANAFLQKPVSREAFLTALDQQIDSRLRAEERAYS